MCTVVDLLQSLFVDGLENFEVFEHVLRSFLYRGLYTDVMSYLLNTLYQQILLLLGRCNTNNHYHNNYNHYYNYNYYCGCCYYY